MKIDIRARKKREITPQLIRSKSLLIRYLIALYQRESIVISIHDDDADDVKIVGNNLQVIDSSQSFHEPIRIDVRDCGAALRFFLPLLASKPGKWLLTGTERALSRPLSPLIESLQCVQADIFAEKDGVHITGKELHASQMSIDARKSSQFASALLLSSQKLGLKKLEILPENPPSYPYILMTQKVLRDIENGDFDIEKIENDWSAALFWYCYIALNPDCCCNLPNLREDSFQGDAIIANWFKNLGVSSIFNEKGVKISKGRSDSDHSDLIFDLRNNPDTMPLLSVLSVCLQRSFIFHGIGNLNHKESRRSDLIMELLSDYSVIEYSENDGYMRINPFTYPQNLELKFKSHHDHRIIMALSLFALYNRVEFDEVDSVKKSYPLFFNDLSLVI